jgi:hypothetical protein
METSEHTFPLPEMEVHKLEEVQHQIEPHQDSPTSKTTEFLKANKWPLVIFGTLGLAIGLALRKRH